MVSNVGFYSFKDINFRKSVPFIVLLVPILVLTAITYDPPKVLFAFFCAYGISGYAYWVWKFWRRRASQAGPENPT
jgi:CDP-diacylglycerol--serine O-phosphatidyltransferase